MERERLKNVDEIFHRCPICRQDVMISQQIPIGSLMHSTVVGSNVLLSSIRPFGSHRNNNASSSVNAANVHFIGEEAPNRPSLKAKNRTPESSARNNSSGGGVGVETIYEDLI